MKINELNTRAAEYFELSKQIEELQAIQEAIKEEIKSAMIEIEQEEITGNGWRATWHNTVTNRFDNAAFKKAHAELYSAFCKPVTGTRFTLNTVKA